MDTPTTVEPVSADLETLPFREEYYDTVIVDAAAELLEDQETLHDRIEALKRLLKNDGTLILTLDGWLWHSGFGTLLRPNLRGVDRNTRIGREYTKGSPFE